MSVAATPRPYKGLMPFEDAELDALLFFGREREREIIVANLLASRLTVLYGPSGVGKSSLLRAGVAHQLRSLPDAEVAVFSAWAEDPTEEIDASIAAAEGRDVYLIFDQIEEYFLYHDRDDPLARRLPELVTTPGLRANVLLGVREDSLAKLDFFKGRIPNLFSNYLRLDHLDRAAAHDAIVGPLHRLNEQWAEETPYAAEPALVDAVLGQVATGQIEYGLAGRGTAKGRDEPARIEAPFLQLVLERLWNVEREARSTTLRLETLDRLGGAEAIVRDHLEGALASLDPGQQELAAGIFEHLVTPSGTKIAHGLGDLAGYSHANRDDLRDVLSRLSRERIVRSLDAGGADGRYEIFHDVLAGGVLAWRTSFEAQRELARERSRRRRAVAIASVALLALAGVAAVALYALSQRERAEDRARSARGRELTARAFTNLTIDPERSLRLAVLAAGLEQTPEVEDALRESLLAARQRHVLSAAPNAAVIAFDPRGRVLVPSPDGVRIYGPTGTLIGTLPLRGHVLAFSADRKCAVTIDGDRAAVREVQTGRTLRSFNLPGPIRAARFDATAKRVAVVAANRAKREYAYVFRVADGRLLHVYRHRGTKSVAFSPDGRLFATGSADKTARVWRLRDGNPVRTFEEHGGHVLAVEFSPDSEHLATASGDSGVRVWRLRDGERRFLFVGHNNPTIALAWRADGAFLADASLDRTSRILDVGSIGAGRMAGVLIGHEAGIDSIAYSPDGLTLATVSADGTARLWDARAEQGLLLLGRHRPGPTRAVFAPDGRRVASAGVDGAAVYDVRLRRRVASLEHAGPVSVVRFDRDGRRIVVGGTGGASLHTAEGRLLAALEHRGAVTDALFTSDGRIVTASADGWARVFGARGSMLAHLDHGSRVSKVAVRADGLTATAAADGTVRLWRPGGQPTVLTGHAGDVSVLRFSPEGNDLVTGGADGVARVWDAETGAMRLALGPHVSGVSDAVFGPGGRSIVTTSFAREVRHWDARTGKIRRDLVGHFAAVNSAAYSSDGRWLVTTSALAAALWRMPSGELFAYLRGHSLPVVRTAEFSPDGRFVVTAADDGDVRLYDCEVCGGVEALVALAKRRLAASRPVR